jgi:hypothetical protein
MIYYKKNFFVDAQLTGPTLSRCLHLITHDAAFSLSIARNKNKSYRTWKNIKKIKINNIKNQGSDVLDAQRKNRVTNSFVT